MPKRKITPAVWEALLSDYVEWDPSVPHAPSIDELIAKHRLSKQAFYAELKRRGVSTKQADSALPAPPTADSAILQEVLVEALRASQLRVKELEQRLAELDDEVARQP